MLIMYLIAKLIVEASLSKPHTSEKSVISVMDHVM